MLVMHQIYRKTILGSTVTSSAYRTSVTTDAYTQPLQTLVVIEEYIGEI